MIFLFLLLSYRKHGKGSMSSRLLLVDDFGFLGGGSYNMTLTAPRSHLNIAYRAYLMKSRYFLEFQINGMFSDLCDFIPNGAEGDSANFIRSEIFNFSLNKEYNWFTPINHDAILTSTIARCENSQKYQEDIGVDAYFMNPNGQHLDSRDVPTLTVIPISLAIFGLMLVAYIIASVINHRKWIGLYFFIIVIDILYIIYLVMYYVVLRKASVSDVTSKWKYPLLVFQYFHYVILFTTIFVTVRGWGLLNVEITWQIILHNFIVIALFFAVMFIQAEINLGYYAILTVAIEVGILAWMVLVFNQNYKESHMHLFAHMFVINQEGYDPQTTPIFKKYRLFQIFITLMSSALLIYIMTYIVMLFINAPDWIDNLFSNLMQMFILGSLMVVYRPMGEKIDRYFRPDFDDTDDDQNRGEIGLEDISSFDPKNTSGRQWEEGMNLPLEPIVIQNNVRPRRNPILSRRNDHHQYIEPLNPQENINNQ